MFMGDAALNLNLKASEKKNMEHHVGRTKSPEDHLAIKHRTCLQINVRAARR